MASQRITIPAKPATGERNPKKRIGQSTLRTSCTAKAASASPAPGTAGRLWVVVDGALSTDDFEALAEEMRRDPAVILYGEDVARFGGIFGVLGGLRQEFGERVFDTPISETAIVGAAVGAAMRGMRPVAELQFADFVFCAGDEIFLKAATWRYAHDGAVRLPLVIRAASGGFGFGAVLTKPLAWRHRFHLDHLPHNLQRCGAFEGRPTRQEKVENRAQTIDVRTGVSLAFATVLFRGRIAGCAQTDSVARLALLEQSGDAEVDQFNLA